MGIDTSMYNSLLRPPKSVAEYDAEAMQGQQNRLAVQMGQAKMDEYQRGIADEQQMRGVVSKFGTDKGANYNALLGAGRLKEAQAYEKANAESVKTGVETDRLRIQGQKDQFETIVKANGMVGSAAGAIIQNPDPAHAAQIVAGLKSSLGPDLAAKLGLDTLEIPQDPAALKQWANDHYLQSIDTDKQLADARIKSEGAADRTQQNTNSLRTAASSKYSADRSAGSAAARLAFDKEKEAGSEDSALGPMATRMIAQQYLAGDNTALGNIGRGTQGAKNLSIVRNEIARQANAQGMNGADIAAKVAEFGGMKAGNRTLGTRTANIEVAAAEAAELAPLALEASAKVSRAGVLAFGKAQIMFDANTNNPDLREFAMANNALVNAFGQVMSRGGAATVSDKEHARELLSTAFDQPSYARAVGQLQKEIDAARRAPGKVRKEMSAATSGREDGHGATAPIKLSTAADYAKVPSGAEYIDPDGHTRRKP